MVFCGLYPVVGDEYADLREALERLRLNDSSFTYEPETSGALGFGFRCGFLGLLHMEIIRERLEREYDLSLVATAPNVEYHAHLVDGGDEIVDNPSAMPQTNQIERIEEPYVTVTVLTPTDHVGAVIELCQARRGDQTRMEYLSEDRVELVYDMPLGEIVMDFFDQLKSRTRGYASLDYEPAGYRPANLAKVDVLLNGVPVDAFSTIVDRDAAYEYGRRMTEKLRELIPRQLFDVPIQAAIGGRIIARETVKAKRKDVIAKCYGGDVSRKRKLLDRQKEGKRELVDLREDGSFKLDMKYFAYDYGLTMTNDRFAKLFGHPVRDMEAPMEQFHWDMAASIQRVTEEIVLAMVRDLHARTGMKNLCMAGGVALNCVANGRIVREGPFENLWVQPAAGDAGGALGAALFAHNAVLGKPRAHRMDHCYWGPAFSDEAIRKYLDARGAPYRTLPREEMIRETATLIAGEHTVVGWFQGRMEWGPRSLGSRSILADARNRENWKRVNEKIKFRESFRPFAPACLEEKASEWFDIDRESPYMLLVCQVKEGRDIPAVTHVDGSARLQTVRRDQHADFYDLLVEFDRQTGCPVLINTSFNVRGEPIVCSPHDAYLCFMRTQMDVLVLGNQILLKQEQPEFHEDVDWREIYALD
jgi:hypothetical protein